MIWQKIKSPLFLFLFTVAVSYREVQILIDRGSWKPDMTWIPLWYIHWQLWYKNFDSFHLMNGLAFLFLLEALIDYLPKYKFKFLANWLNSQLWVVVYWYALMQIRNLFMSVIFT